MDYYTNNEIENMLNKEYRDFERDQYRDDNIFCNDFFTDNNKQLLNLEMEKWRYDGGKFFMGVKNTGPFPSLIAYLLLSMLMYKQFVPLSDYDNVIRKRYRMSSSSFPHTDDQILEARAYQTYTGFLRELDFCQKILENRSDVKIYKNIMFDIHCGVDFIIDIDGQRKYIAIKHEGLGSDMYDNKRKQKKQEEFEEKYNTKVIKLVAKRNGDNKIDLISKNDIFNSELFKDCK